jgi:hypothetical protein
MTGTLELIRLEYFRPGEGLLIRAKAQASGITQIMVAAKVLSDLIGSWPDDTVVSKLDDNMREKIRLAAERKLTWSQPKLVNGLLLLDAEDMAKA